MTDRIWACWTGDEISMWVRLSALINKHFPLLGPRSVVSLSLTGSSCAPLRNMATLETLNFDNRVLRTLPVDKEEKNYVRTVQGACYSRVQPTPVQNPRVVGYSEEALELLDLPSSQVQREDLAEYFAGNKILPGSDPAAHCYCGHQFGNFAGQLGDGCALYLGEVVNVAGERWELQLKGAGKTPYSRQADGRKVLRSSIREFLCSEAMFHLGIPTTRAGTCVTSDTPVARDIFYNGNVIYEKATVISRIAPTFLRFGSFEIFKTRDPQTGRSGPSVGMMDILNQLLDYTITSFFPEVHGEDRLVRSAAFFKELCLRTGRLVAMWQCVGFCHGVLNTDNMSIVGVTIDYGPFGFMDRYDPNHICNGSDDGGRYSYTNQPAICRWNLRKLAEALSPSLSSEAVVAGLKAYEEEFQKVYMDKMRSKLGLVCKQLDGDIDLVKSFLDTMHKTGCDFTNGFLCLSHLPISDSLKTNGMESVLESFLDQCASPQEMARALKSSMPESQLETLTQLMQQSPEILLQLGITPDLITAERTKRDALLKVKNTTVEEKQSSDGQLWMTWLEAYKARLLQEVEGVASHEDLMKINSERERKMKASNPRFVLRNHIAQRAIELAEKGDFSEVTRVQQMLQKPYSLPESGSNTTTLAEDDQSLTRRSYEKPPEWAVGLCVT